MKYADPIRSARGTVHRFRCHRDGGREQTLCGSRIDGSRPSSRALVPRCGHCESIYERETTVEDRRVTRFIERLQTAGAQDDGAPSPLLGEEEA